MQVIFGWRAVLGTCTVCAQWYIHVYYFRSFHSVDSNIQYIHVYTSMYTLPNLPMVAKSRVGNLLPKHGLQLPLPPKFWGPVEIIFINDNFDYIPVTHFSSMPCECRGLNLTWLQHRRTFNHHRNVCVNVPFLQSFLWGVKNCFLWCRPNGYCPEITFCYYTDPNHPYIHYYSIHTHTHRH